MTSGTWNHQETELPRPDENEQRPIVIYDGQCMFCRAQVQRLFRWSGPRLTFLSLHDPTVTERFPFLSHDDLMKQMYVVAPDGRAFGGADAIRFLSRYLPKLWWLAPLVHIPFTRPLIQWSYDWIARRRYAIAGSTQGQGGGCESGACRVHQSGQSDPSD